MLCSVCAFSQTLLDQEVNFTAKNLSLDRALEKLSDKSKVSIAYSKSLLPETAPISIRFKKESLRNVLEYLLSNTGLTYKVIGSQIVLYREHETSEEFTISGYVEDVSTGEKLICANVFDARSGKGTSTNAYGFYSLTLKEAVVSINYSYLGFQIETKNFDLVKDTRINVNLSASLVLNEVIITASDSTSFRKNDFSILDLDDLPVNEMDLLPSLVGETDLIRLAQMIPGVQTGADGLGGLHVRGGNSDQNLFLLDGVPIYNASHLAGLLSVYNSDAIRSSKLIKTGFPVRYGGRLSSVVDVRTKEGNTKELKAEAGIGLSSVRATIEGPLKKDKSSFFISGRRALLDLFVKPITTRIKKDRNEEGFSNYNFFDWNAKMNYSFSNKDKLYLSFYNGRDDFSDESQTSFTDDILVEPTTFEDKLQQNLIWGNKLGALRWNHLFGNKLFSNTTLTYSRYKFIAEDRREALNIKTNFLGEKDTLRSVFFNLYQSEIQDWAIRSDFDFIPKPSQYWRFGFEASQHTFKPGILNSEEEKFFPGFETESDTLFNVPRVNAYEVSAYIEQEWRPLPNWQTILGVRATSFFTGGHTYLRLEPRLAVEHRISDSWTLKSSWSLVSQYLHLLSASGIGLPNDLWLPSTEKVAPQKSWQTTLGFDRRLYEKLTIGTELYYKKMNHLIAYREGGNLEMVDAQNWEDKVTSGDGWSYGAEFYVQKNEGETTGALAYTLSWSERQFDEINFGDTYPFRYDRRHNIKLHVVHRFSDQFSVAGNWVYGSGLATTLPLGEYQFPVDPFFPTPARVFSDKNSIRMPAYHRMDLGANWKKSRSWGKTHLSLGIYNVYNRKNPIYYRVGRDPEDFNKKRYLQATLFHFIPYFSYKVAF